MEDIGRSFRIANELKCILGQTKSELPYVAFLPHFTCPAYALFFISRRSFTRYENPYTILKVKVSKSNKKFLPSQIWIAYAFNIHIDADELVLPTSLQ